MKIIKLDYNKVNFTWMTDLHLSAIPPGRREDDYQKAIFDKIRFVRDLTYRIKGVSLCGGDVFHSKNSKSPSNSISLIEEAIMEFGKFPMNKVFGSIGNHDLKEDVRLKGQPLSLLIAADVYHNLVEEPVLFVNQDETVRVLVESFPYGHRAETLERLLNSSKRPDICTHRIAIIHAYGESGNGGGMFGEAIGYNEIKTIDYDYALWGHDHSRHENEKVGICTHVNLGALARAAFESDEVERPIVAVILSFSEEGIRYKETSVPVTPLKIAFKMEDKQVTDLASSNELKEFFELMDNQVGDVDSTDPNEIIKLLCPEENFYLKSLILELCEM